MLRGLLLAALLQHAAAELLGASVANDAAAELLRASVANDVPAPSRELSEAGDDCLADYQRCITTFSGGKVFQSTAFRERLADDPSLMKLLSCQNACESPPPPSPP